MHGFSLVEMGIATVLMAIVIGVVSPVLEAGINHYLVARELTTTTVKSNNAMTRMSKELVNTLSIQTASAQLLTFTTVDNTAISYRLNGSNLERQEGGGSYVPLVNNVGLLNYTYYDNNLNATNNAASVRLITISLTINNDIEPFRLMESVYPRNLA